MRDIKDLYVNLTTLTDQQLESYIRSLLDIRPAIERNGKTATGLEISISEISILMVIAAAEKNSRASSRLAKVAIAIALAGVFIAAAGMWR